MTIHLIESHENSKDDRIDKKSIEEPLSFLITVQVIVGDIL
jgi:hypothetical protein